METLAEEMKVKDDKVADDTKLVDKHNCEWYADIDRNSKILVEAGLENDFGARDRKMAEWAKHWEETTGATEADLKAQNEGRK